MDNPCVTCLGSRIIGQASAKSTHVMDMTRHKSREIVDGVTKCPTPAPTAEGGNTDNQLQILVAI